MSAASLFLKSTILKLPKTTHNDPELGEQHEYEHKLEGKIRMKWVFVCSNFFEYFNFTATVQLRFVVCLFSWLYIT